jgi:hypothetical protein
VTVFELPAAYRTRLRAIAGEKIWAVLRCRDTNSYAVAIDHETAVLFCTLATPQTLCGSLTKLADQEGQRLLARLVCDQIIQIEQSDGTFVDGVFAYHELVDCGFKSKTGIASRRIDPLSLAAINYALALPSIPVVALARRLYSFNSNPRTPIWDTLLCDFAATTRWLCIDSGTLWYQGLSARYTEHRSGDKSWLQWIRHDQDIRASLRHKIYVSPQTEQLPEVLSVVANVCCAMDVPALKIGATLRDVLRPDRLVVYVDDESALWQVAAELRLATKDFQAHGVPFTNPMDTNGLLSWAIDPEPEARLWPFEEPWSWRMAVAAGLADSIARAKGYEQDAVIIDFALLRLRLDLIDPIGWF